MSPSLRAFFGRPRLTHELPGHPIELERADIANTNARKTSLIGTGGVCIISRINCGTVAEQGTGVGWTTIVSQNIEFRIRVTFLAGDVQESTGAGSSGTAGRIATKAVSLRCNRAAAADGAIIVEIHPDDPARRIVLRRIGNLRYSGTVGLGHRCKFLPREFQRNSCLRCNS